jgi:hypothetical protein
LRTADLLVNAAHGAQIRLPTATAIAQTLKKKAFPHQRRRKNACESALVCYFSRRFTPRGHTALTVTTFEE